MTNDLQHQHQIVKLGVAIAQNRAQYMKQHATTRKHASFESKRTFSHSLWCIRVI